MARGTVNRGRTTRGISVHSVDKAGEMGLKEKPGGQKLTIDLGKIVLRD